MTHRGRGWLGSRLRPSHSPGPDLRGSHGVHGAPGSGAATRGRSSRDRASRPPARTQGENARRRPREAAEDVFVPRTKPAGCAADRSRTDSWSRDREGLRRPPAAPRPWRAARPTSTTRAPQPERLSRRSAPTRSTTRRSTRGGAREGAEVGWCAGRPVSQSGARETLGAFTPATFGKPAAACTRCAIGAGHSFGEPSAGAPPTQRRLAPRYLTIVALVMESSSGKFFSRKAFPSIWICICAWLGVSP